VSEVLIPIACLAGTKHIRSCDATLREVCHQLCRGDHLLTISSGGWLLLVAVEIRPKVRILDKNPVKLDKLLSNFLVQLGAAYILAVTNLSAEENTLPQRGKHREYREEYGEVVGHVCLQLVESPCPARTSEYLHC